MATVMSSCEKELDFKYIDIDPIIVIEGELTPDGVKVGLTMTTPMDEPMDRSHITDATVTLTDLTDEVDFTLAPDDDGFYVAATTGTDGHRYRLSVDRGAAHYEAETLMLGPTEITNLEFDWVKMPYDRVAILQAKFTDDPAVMQFYWVKLYRNGEIYSWEEVDDRSADNGTLTIFYMTTREDTDEEDDDRVIFDGDEITLSVAPITHEMHDYLEALKNDSNGPAMFTGDKCLGYFTATSPVERNIVFRLAEIPDAD